MSGDGAGVNRQALGGGTPGGAGLLEARYPCPMRALVKNGRLTLDEPTDLPDGTLVPLEVAGDWDDLDDQERAALHDALREGFEEAKAGHTIDAEQWAAELRSRL